MSANTAEAFNNYLLNSTVDTKNIISPETDGIYFNFFDVFASFDSVNAVVCDKYNNYLYMLPYFYLCTDDFLIYGESSFGGVLFDTTPAKQTLEVYDNLLKIKNSLDNLMSKKYDFITA